jgi:hypothetical protein
MRVLVPGLPRGRARGLLVAPGAEASCAAVDAQEALRQGLPLPADWLDCLVDSYFILPS